MLISTSFEGSTDIAAFTRLTNSYCLIGRSNSRVCFSSLQVLDIPLIECTINTIKTVGSLSQGNKNGLLLPHTTTDHELQHIRNSLPQNIKVRRINERLNALGNVVLCNDRFAIVHPELDSECIQNIQDVLMVEVFKHSIGSEPLVGTFACLNNVGMLVHPYVVNSEIEELCELLEVQILAGTVNRGDNAIGAGLSVNDWAGIVGYRSTVHERSVIETVFKLNGDVDVDAQRKALIQTYTQ